MPKKKDPYSSPAQKVLALYGLLLFTGRKYSLPQLAQLLHCSKQTVLRLVEQILLTHTVKVESWTEGNKRWFQIKDQSRKPNVSLTVQQIQSLLLCRDMVLHMLPKSLKDEITGTISRTTAMLGDYEEREKVQPAWVEPRPKGFIDYSGHQLVLETLLTAIRERRVCHVKYQAPQKPTPKDYAIGPIKLITHQDALYVSALVIPKAGDKCYPDPILLAVHRFKRVKVVDEEFSAPKEACCAEGSKRPANGV